MITITAKPGATLSLGRAGENLARKIVFDVSAWREEYGPGAVSLVTRRPGDEAPYPCAVTVDGTAVTWIVTSADTARPGRWGRCELQYRVDDTLVKSESWRTVVADALGEAAPEPPEPQRAWMDRVLEAEAACASAAETARAAAKQAESAAVHQPCPDPDTGTWWVWDAQMGTYGDTGIAATGPAGPSGMDGMQGEPGMDGLPGEPGYTPQRGVDYWTEEDKSEMLSAVLEALPNAEGVSF